VDQNLPSFSDNVVEVIVDQVLFRFSIRRSVSEIFANKVESCQKLHRILDVFRPPIFWGGFQKSYQRYLAAWRQVTWKDLVRIYYHLPRSYIGAHKLNFSPNFKFSRLTFFLGGGWTSVPFGMCAMKPRLISSACKNLRAQNPIRAEIQSPDVHLYPRYHHHVVWKKIVKILPLAPKL